MTLISVVICTYDRANLLRDALESVCKQSIGSDQYEVLVVDNNSTDGTREVVATFADRYPNISYCKEERQGLSFARNRGLQEARGEYLGFIDDDCRVPFQWLEVAANIIRTRRPAVFGGPSNAVYLGIKPLWFKDSYGCRTISKDARPLIADEYVRGFNMFFSKSILQRLNGFDIHLGMNGKKVAYGEDIAIQMELRKRFPAEVIYFDPRLYVDHLVRLEKMTIGWLLRSFFAKGRYVYMITQELENSPPNRPRLVLRAMKILTVLPIDLTLGLFIRNRDKFPYVQNYLYEHTSRYLRGLGRTYAQFLRQRSQQ